MLCTDVCRQDKKVFFYSNVAVVVRKSQRGKGYGRVLMEKTEEFACRYKFKFHNQSERGSLEQWLVFQTCDWCIVWQARGGT